MSARFVVPLLLATLVACQVPSSWQNEPTFLGTAEFTPGTKGSDWVMSIALPPEGGLAPKEVHHVTGAWQALDGGPWRPVEVETQRGDKGVAVTLRVPLAREPGQTDPPFRIKLTVARMPKDPRPELYLLSEGRAVEGRPRFELRRLK